MTLFSFLSYFRPWWKNADTDYETVLIRLTSEIQSVQAKLTSVKTRERRASVTLTIYAFLAWLAYCAFCWWAHPLSDDRREMVVYVYAPCAVVPVMILSTRRVVRWWYRRIAAGEEKHLLSLQRARRSKIEEIKRATRYDSLRVLLEKYDDSKPGPKPAAATTAKKPSAPAPQQPATAPKGAAAPAPNTAPLVPAPIAAPPAPKTWLDKVADAVLGADPGTAGPEQRYALICKACFGHNGLCPKDEFEEIQYVCPKCGTFNSRRPSSVPVSSPWAVRQRVGSGASAGSVPPSPSQRGDGRFLGVSGNGDESISRSSSRGTIAKSPLVDKAGESEEDSPPAEPLRAGRDEGGDDEDEVKGYNLRERRKAASGANESMEVD